MKTSICIGFAVLLLATAASSMSLKRGSCLIMCGLGDCPSGYACRSNGCGTQCFRTTFVQPPGCPVYKCVSSCPTGYVRDEQGCESCECDYSRLLGVTLASVTVN
ncbi:hypothetical protein BsWGS_21417 [Bradybaena similaris]